jgi:hypothetical protein
MPDDKVPSERVVMARGPFPVEVFWRSTNDQMVVDLAESLASRIPHPEFARMRKAKKSGPLFATMSEME